MANTGAITVYLDSQDYSRMSDVRTRTPELDQVRDVLQRHATTGKVKFVFSAAIISEMTPLDAQHASIASRKADLLFDLCGPHTLISLERLFDAEVAHLLKLDRPPVNAISDDATWFPNIPPDLISTRWLDTKKVLAETLKERGSSRAERRETMRKSFKGNVPTKAFRASLTQQDGQKFMNAFLQSYPMRPEDANVWVQYALGNASEVQLNDALLSSFRYPRWMMKWFSNQHDLAGPMIEWVRGPSNQIGKVMRDMVAHAKLWSELRAVHDLPSKPEMLTAKGWGVQCEKQILTVTSRWIEDRFPGHSKAISYESVELNCLGTVSMIRSFYSALWDSVGGGRSALPSDSQAVDVMHAAYAPYVNVFRADRYMAPHISKQVKRFGTRVVNRLEDVPAVLSELILQRGGQGEPLPSIQ